jgi:Spy/CpxP family protein refolding chaperone
MKNILLILLLITFGMNAQERKYEKIKAYKTTYITEQVKLTPEQAEKFWPVFHKMEKEIITLKRQERKKFEENKNINDMSDNQANAMLKRHIQVRKQLLDKRQELISSLKDIITPQQIITLLNAEEGFKKRLLRRYSERNHGGKDRDKKK